MSDRSINLEKAIEDIDKAVFAKEKRHLSDAEETILRGAGQSKNYDEIAEISSYKSNYLRGDVGPKLWKLLTEALGEKVSMRNFQEVLERRWEILAGNGSHLQESIQSDSKIEVKEGTSSGSNFAEDRGAIVSSPRQQKWSTAPDVSVFYGRKEDLDTLEKWIIEDNYKVKVLAILGLPGIGKTFLATKLAHEIENKGYTIIWRSLENINTPLVENLLADLIECLSPQAIPIPKDINDRISLLISYLQNSPYLLVLDNWDTILKEGNLAGQYEDKYKDYGKFLKRLGEEFHKSCLVITSREKPKEIALLEGETGPVRAIELKGLGKDAHSILQAKGLREDEQEKARWETLIRVYKGNPLALELICPTIKEVFDGSVSAFITDTGSANLGYFDQMLEALFERLSNKEKDILYWLAIKQKLQIKDEIPYLQALAENQPNQISLSELENNLLQTSQPELYAAIKSLRERSLIEKGVANYTLQPVVWEYVRNKFVEDVCQEIQSLANKSDIKLEELKLLKSHALNKSPDKSDVKEGKSRPIIVLIKERLYAEGILSKESSSIDKLKKIKSKLEGKTQLEVGYAPENMSLLIEKLSAD